MNGVLSIRGHGEGGRIFCNANIKCLVAIRLNA